MRRCGTALFRIYLVFMQDNISQQQLPPAPHQCWVNWLMAWMVSSWCTHTDTAAMSTTGAARTLIWWYSTMGVAAVDASDRGPMAQVMGRGALTIHRLSARSLAFSGRSNSTRICGSGARP
jgi:hypothetical protein